jgi:hypothetical protein
VIVIKELAERVGFFFALMPKDFGSSRFVTSPKSYQKWAKSPLRNVAEIGDKKGVSKDASLECILLRACVAASSQPIPACDKTFVRRPTEGSIQSGYRTRTDESRPGSDCP